MTSAYGARATLSGAGRPIGTLIAVGSIALLILPFFSTFGELLTKAAMAAGFDAWLGQWIAPIEGQLVHGALALIGIPSAYDGSLLYVGTGAGRHAHRHRVDRAPGRASLLLRAAHPARGARGGGAPLGRVAALGLVSDVHLLLEPPR